MSGKEALRRAQLGAETTPGTAVAATAIWRGRITLQSDEKVVLPEEDAGVFGGYDRSYIPFLGAGADFEETPATYEQLPYLLNAGIAAATPVQDGTGSGYIYTYTLAESAEPTIKTYTIEGSDDTQIEEMEYAFVDELTLSGASKEAVMMSAHWTGRQLTPTTHTTGLTPPTVSEILFGNGMLYIDDIDDTPGTTLKANTLLGFKLSLKTGLQPLYSADGAVYFATHAFVSPEPELELTLLHNAVGRAEVAAMQAQTPRLIRLKFEGPALQTGGTTYSKKTLIIDCSGKYESKPPLAARDGNDIVTLKLLIKRNTGATVFGAKRLEMVVVNELSALP